MKSVKESSRFWWLFAAYGLICLCIAIWGQVPWRSDSLNYYRFAQESIALHNWFPHTKSVHYDWIATPLYINILIATLKIFQTPTSLLVLAVGFNLVQLYLIHRLTERFFGAKAAWIAALVYVLYLNNLGLVLLNYTELPFGCFVLLSLYFFTAQPSLAHFYLAGLTAGLALGIRPTMAPLIGIYGAWIVFTFWKAHRYQWITYTGILALGLATYIVPAGLYSKHSIGYFIFTSNTGPANMVMSAFEGATGVYNDTIFKTDSVLLSKTTFSEKNAYLTKRSVEWIKSHPFRWLSFWPRKFTATFTTDDIAIGQLLGGRWTLNQWMSDSKLPIEQQLFRQEPFSFRIAFYLFQGWQQLFYLFLFGIWGYQFYNFWKKRLTAPLIALLLNGFTVLGLLLTFVGSVGMPRYKYTYLVVSIILIAPILQQLFSLEKQKKVSINSAEEVDSVNSYSLK